MKDKLKLFILVTLGMPLLLVPPTMSAGTIDGVAIVINKEPVTLYDVYKYSQRFNISKKEALDILVRQKLEDSEIKKLEITVDNFEVDQYIENLAISNNMNQFDFLNMIRSKNVDVSDYKDEIKKKLQRDKLYKKIIRDKAPTFSDEELLAYYNNNQGEFSQSNVFDVTVYTSANQQSLTAIQKNPMSAMTDVNLQETTYEIGKMDQNLANLLNQTKAGQFSTVVKADQNYVMFFVKNKSGGKTVSYAEAKNYIQSKLSSGKEQKSVEEYFEKLKSSAAIQVVRAP